MTTTADHKEVRKPRPRKSMEPWLKDDIEFYDYQVVGVRWGIKKKSFILADDMGLGKSLQTLAVMCADIVTGKGDVFMIVCPVSLRLNWAVEVEKFTRIPYVLLGEEIDQKSGKIRTLTPYERSAQIVEFAFMRGPKILIANYDQVKAHIGELNALRIHAVAFDEAHGIKNHDSQRTQSCLELKSVRSFMLTGTPLLNQVADLWPLLNRISPRLFPDPHRFINTYCVKGGYKNKKITGVKNQQRLNGILAEVMLRRLKKDVLDLPEVHYIQVPVDLHPDQQKLYDEVNEEWRLANFDPDADDEVIEYDITKYLRLQQICGTPATFGHPDNSYKLDAATDKAEEIIANGNKLIIFTRFRPVLAAMSRRLRERGIAVFELHGDVSASMRVPLVNTWSNMVGPSVILCMTQVAGVGLNMTAARHVFFIDKLYVPGLNRQAVDRSHRIGQSVTQPVTVFEFIARGTVEYRVEQINRDKLKLSDNVFEGVDVARKLLQLLKESDK